jgi:hypothetical protein
MAAKIYEYGSEEYKKAYEKVEAHNKRILEKFGRELPKKKCGMYKDKICTCKPDHGCSACMY